MRLIESIGRSQSRLHFQNNTNCLATIVASMLLATLISIEVKKVAAEDAAQSKKVQKKQTWITISKETTFLTKPLNEEGYVDYLAALNLRASEGVTVDNNAGVLFVKVVSGLPEFTSEHGERFCELLRIEPLKEDEPIFHALGQLNNGEQTDFGIAMSEPWSAEEFPRFADWLESNRESLALIIEGTLRPRCYFPWLPSPNSDSDTLMNVTLPATQQSRDFARALVSRAMLRLHEGKIDEAKQDLLTCHRLSRLVGSTPCLISGLVGIAIDRVVGIGDIALMQHGKLNASQALAYQSELRKLQPLPSMANEIHFAERLIILDEVVSVIRSTQKELLDLKGVSEEKIIADARIMYDEMLRVVNEGFDKLAAAGRQETGLQRKQAAENVIRDFEESKGAEILESDVVEIVKSIFEGQLPREIGMQLGQAYLAKLAPSAMQAYEAENRAKMRDALAQLGFALVAYHADHTGYPESLDALAPKYISNVPNDLYNGQALTFTRIGDGFLLYSVGANGVDDGGQTFESQPPGDDIVLQIPAKAEW